MASALLERYTRGAVVGEISPPQLRAAIASVTRAAGLDDVRAQLIKRAGALKRGGWVPDNWRADGSLKDTQTAWSTPEQRETWNDLYVGRAAALDELVEDLDGYWYVWVQDFTATDVIFCMGGDLYSAPYTVVEGGPITVGAFTKVRPVTNYVPTEVDDTTATGARAGGPRLEWRRAKTATLKGLERRTFQTNKMELREQVDGMLKLTGYASVTDKPYDVGWYQETIKRGAFRRTLGEQPDVQLLINHTGMPLARTTSGTLQLSEDDTGLYVDADLDPEDPDVQSLARKMLRGDIDQMSFAFQATAQSWNDDYTEREITVVSIHRGDVSVVNQGANPATSSSIRSHDALVALHRLGLDAVVGALTDWRDHTLLPLEERAGKALSAATMEVLTQLAGLLATADDAMDEAIPLLAELMGVPNPDADEAAEPADDTTTSTRRAGLPDHTKRARQELAALRGGR